MTFEKATRKSTHLIVSFSGPSGCGKSLSALRFARGLVGPEGKIGFIDTESGRSGMYADKHDFHVSHLRAPFTPDRYIEKIRAAEDAGFDVLVIDQASFEWDGDGGMLEFADSQKTSGGRALSGELKWLEPKKRHKKFINALLDSPMHIVVCLRAKPEYERVVLNGKESIVFKCWAPIQQPHFLFEMTVSAMLHDGGLPDLAKCPGSLRHAFDAAAPVDEETGRKVAAWLGDVQRDPELARLTRHAGDEAERGIQALQEYWGTLTKEQQLKLKPRLEDYKARAREVDGGAEQAANENRPDLEDPFGNAGRAAAAE